MGAAHDHLVGAPGGGLRDHVAGGHRGRARGQGQADRGAAAGDEPVEVGLQEPAGGQAALGDRAERAAEGARRVVADEHGRRADLRRDLLLLRERARAAAHEHHGAAGREVRVVGGLAARRRVGRRVRGHHERRGDAAGRGRGRVGQRGDRRTGRPADGEGLAVHGEGVEREARRLHLEPRPAQLARDVLDARVVARRAGRAVAGVRVRDPLQLLQPRERRVPGALLGEPARQPGVAGGRGRRARPGGRRAGRGRRPRAPAPPAAAGPEREGGHDDQRRGAPSRRDHAHGP